MIKVLSIDGGGIRGIIPLMVLKEIEKQSGRRIAESFDLVAGTSTGGLIALGLTKPNIDGQSQYSAKEILQIYLDRGPHIFHRSLWRRIMNIGHLFGPKYSSDNLKDTLTELLGDATLSQATTDIMITSYDLIERKPVLFKSRKGREDKECNYLMRDAGLATSVAPAYFPPAEIGKKLLIDGGVYVNNPAMSALVEALKMFPNDKEIMLVSLGTGQYTDPIRLKGIKRGGIVHWIPSILDVVFDGESDLVDYQVMKMLENLEHDHQHYYRFQTELDDKNDKLDNARPENIERLVELGAELARDERIGELVRRLWEE